MENQETENNYKGARQNSPMEVARKDAQNNQRGLNKNPYITDNEVMMEESVSTTPTQSKSVTDSLLGSFDTADFVKGALIGAVGAYLLTNETAQKAIFKGVAKTTGMLQAGMEEMKERYEDAQAELEAEQEA